MRSVPKVRVIGSKAELVLMFAMHQFIGIVGVMLSAVVLTSLVFNSLRPFWGRVFTSSNGHWILAGTPYFPVQIFVGLLLGWLLGGLLRDRLMLRVWVLPFLYLCYAFFMGPSVAFLTFRERLSRFFGWGCRSGNHCLDWAVTGLFYVASSYSIGALLARKMSSHSRQATKLQFWAALAVGIIILVAVAVDLLVSTRSDLLRSLPPGFWGLALLIAAVPAVIGAFLIYFAFIVRGKPMSAETESK